MIALRLQTCPFKSNRKRSAGGVLDPGRPGGRWEGSSMQISCRLRPRALTDCWPKSKRAWTRLSALTRGSRALITGYWSLSETQRPRGPYAATGGTTCERGGGGGEEADESAQKTKQKKRASELTFLQQQVEENFCSGSPQRAQIPGCHIQGCLSADLQQLIRSIKS